MRTPFPRQRPVRWSHTIESGTPVGRCLGAIIVILTLLGQAGCDKAQPWTELQTVRPADYAIQTVLGLNGGQVAFAGYDTLWILSEGALLTSTDGGRHWHKKLVQGTGYVGFGSESFVVSGPRLWISAGCEVLLSTDGGTNWKRSGPVPGCEDGTNGLSIPVPRGEGVLLATSNGVFETDGALSRWTEHLRISSDPNHFTGFIASERWLWLLENNSLLHYAPVSNPARWRTYPVTSVVAMEWASGDTVWVRSATEILAAQLGGYQTRTTEYALVATSSGLLLADSAVLPPETDWRTPPRQSPWLWKDGTIHYRGKGGAAFSITLPSEILQVASAGSGRLVAFTTDAAFVLDERGQEVGRVPEPAGSWSACAVQHKELGWYAFLSDGSTFRADSTFLWTQMSPRVTELNLSACAFGEALWAAGSDAAGEAIFRWANGQWTRVRRLAGSTVTQAWIHAYGGNVWASASPDVLEHSSDNGRSWKSMELEGLVPESLHGSGRQVWYLAQTTADSLVRLHLLSADRAGEKVVTLPSQGRDAWLDGDSIWMVDGSNYLYLSPDQGRTWERREIPSAGAPSFIVEKTGPILSVETASIDGESVLSSLDGGLNWREWRLPTRSRIAVSPGSPLIWQNDGYGSAHVFTERETLPRLTQYRLRHRLTDVSLELALDFAGASPTARDSVTFELAGVDSHDRAQGEYDPFENTCRRKSSSANWECSFSPEAAGIRPGDKGHLLLTMVRGEFRHGYLLPAFTFLPWWRRLPPALLWTVLAYTTIVTAAALLWLLRPLWLHHLFWELHRHASHLPWVGGTVGKTALNVLLPYFAHHSRVLDAWVETQAGPVAEGFRALDPRLIPPEQYVPLPLAELTPSPTGRGMLEVRRFGEPGVATFRPYFEGERTLLEILGGGGTGKTTLALRIANWALGTSDVVESSDRISSLTAERLGSHRMLPVWVDEDTDALLKLATRQLRAWTHEDVPEDFVRRLLVHGRVLVVADRLSERSGDTRDYLRRAYGELRVRRMVVTSRAEIYFEAQVTTFLGTCELTFDSLARLVTARLAVSDPDPARKVGELPRPHPDWSPEKQAELTTRITRLFRVPRVEGQPIPLQPLLVRIAVDEAAALRRAGAPAAALAPSIPRLVENYLVSLNPSDADQDPLSHPAMLRAAQLAATTELGTAFRPRSFSRAEARAAFEAEGWKIDAGSDPLRRLVSNGVLVNEGLEYMRFRLDPVAEFVAAEAAVQERANDPESWQALLEQVDKAGAHHYRTILMALLQIRTRAALVVQPIEAAEG